MKSGIHIEIPNYRIQNSIVLLLYILFKSSEVNLNFGLSRVLKVLEYALRTIMARARKMNLAEAVRRAVGGRTLIRQTPMRIVV
jgi:hypothetical protein